FRPAPIPFPVLHIDTSYKFREMIEFRDRICSERNVKLLVYTNRQSLTEGANPFVLGTEKCCGQLKTKALLDALKLYSIDGAIRGRLLIPLEHNPPLLPGDRVERVLCRFRTLGCTWCTGAIRSTATTVSEIVHELRGARRSERETRIIDHDTEGSMEIKKRQGY